MAKPPETRERMRIFCEADLEQVGPIINVLTKLGVAAIGHELITDVATFKQRVPREKVPSEKATAIKDGGPAVDFIREYAKKNPVFALADLKKHFREIGRNADAVSPAIGRMTVAGELRKLARGQYQLSGVKALPAPAKKTKAAKPEEAAKPGRGRGPRRLYEVNNKDFILAYMAGRGEISVRALIQHFEQNGRNVNSVTPIMTKFGHEKILKNKGGGIWDVTAKGVKLALSKLNGAAEPAAVEQANG